MEVGGGDAAHPVPGGEEGGMGRGGVGVGDGDGGAPESAMVLSLELSKLYMVECWNVSVLGERFDSC